MAKSEKSRVAAHQFPGLKESPLAEVELCDEEETRRLGRFIARRLEGGDFLGLVGDLGAGKTTLMQGLVAELSRERQIASSPTYALVQIYDTTPPIHHLDLYRLEGWGDLESIGYWDLIDDRDAVNCVEWLDRIPGAWPGGGIIVELLREKGQRRVRIWADSARGERLSAQDLPQAINSAIRNKE